MLSVVLTMSLIAAAQSNNSTSTFDSSSSTLNTHKLETRSLTSLIWSCLTIIFSCTWVSIHPNIPGPDDSTSRIFLRKVKIFIVAVLAPEWMVMWAMRQMFRARQLRDEVNETRRRGKKGALSGTDDSSRPLMGESGQIYDEESQAGKKKNERDLGDWTLTHGFFMVMGGFTCYIPDKYENMHSRPIVLSADGAEVNQEYSDFLFDEASSITKEEILDRSKGDHLAKVLILSQLIWFAIQVLARAIRRLPVPPLEIATIGYVFVSSILYAVWWNKPLDVKYPIRVKLSKNAETKFVVAERPHSPTDTSRLLASYFLLAFASEYVDGVDCTKVSRLPTFYTGASIRDSHFTAAFVAEMTLGSIFGAIHCVAWSFPFNSILERHAWRISGVAVAGIPAVLLFLLGMSRTGLFRHFKIPALWRDWSFFVVSVMFFTGYIIARVVLLAISFSSLRGKLPDGTLDVVKWTSFFPHAG